MRTRCSAALLPAIAVCLTLPVLVCAHPVHDVPAYHDVPKIRESMIETDFSEELGLCRFITFNTDYSTLSDYERRYIKGMEEYIGREIPIRDLTRDERRRLGMWQMPSGSYVKLSDCIDTVIAYYEHNGHLPYAGPDLYEKFLLTSMGQQSFESMDASGRLHRFFHAINPVTGKFYQTYEAREWRAGEFNIELVSDPQKLASEFGSLALVYGPHPRGTSGVEAYYDITIWGENPGTVMWHELRPVEVNY